MGLPEWLPAEEWEAYIAMRKQMGKKFHATEYAQKLLIKKLTQMKEEGCNVKAVLEQSIMRSWVGLFPVQQDRKDSVRVEIQLDRVQATKSLIESYETPRDSTRSAYQIERDKIFGSLKH